MQEIEYRLKSLGDLIKQLELYRFENKITQEMHVKELGLNGKVILRNL
jgi:hypothetical protein